MRARVVVGACALSALVAVSLTTGAAAHQPTRRLDATPTPTPVAHVIAAVGDIACSPSSSSYKGGKGTPSGCQQNNVAALLKGRTVDAFLPLGDEQYQVGALQDFRVSYQHAFGSYLSISQPVPGNHEYYTKNAAGYFTYFGPKAHAATKGTYSYNLDGWHFIAINAETCQGGGCAPGSALMKWLQADLAASKATKCTIAYWHEPLWSTGLHPTYVPIAPVWNALVAGGVDVVLNGHDHNYQRFAPLGKATYSLSANTVKPPVIDRVKGIRTFVVGTGGESNYPWGSSIPAQTRKAIDVRATNPNHGIFGLLLVTLQPTGYSWQFVQSRTTGAASFSDSGTGTCH